MRYSQGFKRSTVSELLQPNPPTVQELSEDTGVSQQTLYNWLHQLKKGWILPHPFCQFFLLVHHNKYFLTTRNHPC